MRIVAFAADKLTGRARVLNVRHRTTFGLYNAAGHYSAARLQISCSTYGVRVKVSRAAPTCRNVSMASIGTSASAPDSRFWKTLRGVLDVAQQRERLAVECREG